MTFGEKAVGASFNPSDKKEVDQFKKISAEFIDFCHALRSTSNSQEVKRMLSIAITEAQTAQIWAVKAVTWSDE